MEQFIAFVQNFGLPLSILLFILATGSTGKWVYGKLHDQIVAGKDKQIADWKTLAQENAKIAVENARIASESLAVARESRESLVRIEARLKRRSTGDDGGER